MRKMVAITVTFSDYNGVELDSGGYCLLFFLGLIMNYGLCV